MSNRGGIDSSITSYLEADHQVLFLAVKAEFDTDTVRVWSGDYDLVIDGGTYTGVGTLLSISNIEDTLELKSSGLSVALAGMDTTVLDLALTENYQNRFITVYLGYLSGGTDTTVGTMTLFKGRMQSMVINDDPNGSTITVDAENRLIDLQRPSNLRYTKESQQFIDSTDTCFNRVQSLQDKEIVWGRSSSNTGGGTGGGGGGGGGGCFISGTQILMGDKSYKNIEDVKLYDEIYTYDINKKLFVKSSVLGLHETSNTETVIIKNKHKNIHTTPCHPIYTLEKGWASVDPSLTKEHHTIDVMQLEINDTLLLANNEKVKVKKLVHKNHKTAIKTYNLLNIYQHNSYFANDILVHNKRNVNSIAVKRQ